MKQNYTSILRRTLSAVLLLMLSTLARADYYFESGNIWYRINEDGTSVTLSRSSNSQECSGDVVIPSTVVHEDKAYRVTGIGEQAFYSCASLTSVSLPEGLTSIGEAAFMVCTSLTSVSFPEGLTSIGGYAFAGCSSLTSISLPEGLTSIGGGAFRDCTSLASASFPDGLTSIGERAFYGCTSLTSVSLPEGLTSIGGDAFYRCTSLSSVSLPEGLTKIGENAFEACTSLTSIDLPEGLKRIEEYAFTGCTSLVSIEFPKGMTYIGSRAFEGCTSLASIDIPDGLIGIGIGGGAFWGCTSVTTVICRAKRLPNCEGYNSPFDDTAASKATLYVPSSSLSRYSRSDPWKAFGTILPLEDYETGIDTPASQQESGTGAAPYYTLDGRRVTAPVRGGVYVRGGRKVMVR